MTHEGHPRLFALVPCAGTGERAGAGQPKQYVLLAGRSVVAHTLDALSRVRGLSGLLVVLAPEDRLFERAVPGFGGPDRWVARCGGASRADSVAAGLAALRAQGASGDDWVLVHDAARCLLRPAWVERLVDACRDDPVGGLLALPVADTLKQARGERVQATVTRADKWAAQTPQMFRLGLLEQALRASAGAVTDESGAIEALGMAPRLVTGELENLKVTFPADFALAERLLATRQPLGDSPGAGPPSPDHPAGRAGA
jgi:2-C-methyl-D-erythritol 4-phosphate cytidylyltransferase